MGSRSSRLGEGAMRRWRLWITAGLLAVVVLGCGPREEPADAGEPAQPGPHTSRAALSPQEEGETSPAPKDVHLAAKEGDLAQLEELFAASPGLVHAKDQKGLTPLALGRMGRAQGCG